jgi:hypothetical protein
MSEQKNNDCDGAGDVSLPGLAWPSGPLTISVRQRYFVRYILAVLLDLAVLNLYDEYWSVVQINSFTISLFSAFIIQILLQATILLEHKIAAHLKAQKRQTATAIRYLATLAIMFGSKFVILGAIDLIFGEQVLFGGIIPFIVVVLTMLATEVLIARIIFLSVLKAA